MSRLSIYENNWIDIVFENRNKEYGAYQLRRDNVKSAVSAFFFGLLFVASIGVIATIASRFNPENPTATPTRNWDDEIIQVTDVVLPVKETAPAQHQTQQQTVEVPITQKVVKDPIIVKSSDANQNIATNEEMAKMPIETSVGTTTTVVNPITSGTGNTTITTPIEYGNSVVNTAVLDKMPEFPGGISQFYKYVGNNFENPEIDAMGNIKILVYFVIEKDGTMSDIQIKRDPGYGLGAEAIRVLKSLKTKWAPGIINSKPVRTAYNLPIIIKLD